ncbi:MAG: fatty acid desaturase [Planctomycetota bacterium]|nr:fatty acid desaturase [Planctomycetota bacterium]
MTTPWTRAAETFRAELRAAVPAERLQALHTVQPWRHALTVLRQLVLLALAAWAILTHGDLWYAWIPASIVIGFVVFDFTVLVHEAVHEVIVSDRKSRLHTLLGHLYALPSGLSFSQFRRWHLDHHANLGTDDADPKRAYLSPKKVLRRVKLLYMTPALFPIYFRAARRAAAGYPPELKRKIAWERRAAILLHLAIPAVLWWQLGFEAALKLHLLPVFVVFPVAFTLNRLGQHYDIDPEDPAHWGTLMRPSPLLWDRIYLWSNYHIEHHYFPGVPMYHLPALHRELRGFFEKHGMRPRTYGGLLMDWLVRNRAPHTDWSAPKPERAA